MSRADKRVAVIQSNYLPWKGYFDIANDVDLFVFHDDLQYTRGDWRNRNLIKTAAGLEWLTVPVGASQRRRICDVRISDRQWPHQHWRRLQQHYGHAPHFRAYGPFVEELLRGRRWDFLSELNQTLIRRLARELLGISTEFRDSRELAPAGRKLERLLDLLAKARATTYVSGPAAHAYIDAARFAAAGVELVWKDYSGYPAYPQHHPPFVHGVTILDLVFHTGPAAPDYVWGWRQPLPVRMPQG